jgi:hypothetical protein
MIIRLHFKFMPFGSYPTYSIHISLPYFERIHLKERGDHIHLSIMNGSSKNHIPLNPSISELQMIHHPRVLTMCDTKQIWIRYLQWLFSSPDIMPKTDLWPITYLKSNKFWKSFPHPLYIFPHTRSKWADYFCGTPINYNI